MENVDSIRGHGAVRAVLHARILVLGAAVALGLAGCAAGPDFERPMPPDTPRYTDRPLPQATSSAATLHGREQRVGAAQETGAPWWHSLGSPRLNALVEQAFARSPTLEAASATLRQAQETHSALSGSTLYPRIDANIGAQRQRASPASLGQEGPAREFGLASASLGLRYQFDLAGGNRRSLEALAAKSEYRRHELQGAHVTLAANIVTAAIHQARIGAQLEATRALVRTQEEQLQLTGERVRLGNAAETDLLSLRSQLEQTRAGMPALHKQLQQQANLLAVLAGAPPGTGSPAAFELHEFTLPRDLPGVLPSELVRRRPDILGAEALLHAANAEYSVAIARLYPQVALSATLGSQALSASSLFGSGSAIWSLVGQLTQPLLDPGLPAQKRAALAAFDAAAANYRKVVLESLRDVADALAAVEHDADALRALAAADAAAEGSLESVKQRHGLGAASYVDVVVADERLRQSRMNLISAQAQRLLDTANLHRAMGGG
jgi:NodT family efflux transporter outer membrane factor (OMF) lipoprotein